MEDVLIGHRGEPACRPENSLRGFNEVLEAGARYIETDVQVSVDRVAILSHDVSLLKTTGHDLVVTETGSEVILSLPAGHTERFGDRFTGERIATLQQFATLLAQWPDAIAFVEIKQASIQTFGVEPVVELMLDALATVREQVIPISFEYPLLQHIRHSTGLPIGWVLPEWNDETRRLADALSPEYLFVNRRLVPDRSTVLWRGPWRWAAYTVNQAADVTRLLAQGFDFVETDDFRRLASELKAAG